MEPNFTDPSSGQLAPHSAAEPTPEQRTVDDGKDHHRDGLGSTRALTDAAGVLTDTSQADKFGVAGAGAGSSTQPGSTVAPHWHALGTTPARH